MRRPKVRRPKRNKIRRNISDKVQLIQAKTKAKVMKMDAKTRRRQAKNEMSESTVKERQKTYRTMARAGNVTAAASESTNMARALSGQSDISSLDKWNSIINSSTSGTNQAGSSDEIREEIGR